MYKLVIADDESNIRNGLSRFVDWASLSFEVAACLEDGDEVIAYIENNPADVVITDIKMLRVSGLDVAKYIYENCSGVRVVILSGYADFEYAKEAISYNVKQYLLKPTKTDEIVKVFKELKEELDAQLDREEKLKEERGYLSELLPLMRRQFFIDVMLGIYSDPGMLIKKMRLLNIPDSLGHETANAGVLSVSFSQPKENGKHSRDSFETAVKSFLELSLDGFLFYPANSGDDYMNFVFFGNGRPDEKKASSEIFSLLGITAKIYTEGFYPDIFTLATEHYKQTGKGGISGYKKLLELQDSLISYISEGDIAAVNAIYDIIAEKISTEEPQFAAQIFSNILTVCESKLNETGISIAGCFDGENYKASENIRETLIKMTEFTAKNKVSGSHVIEQAKRYAEQNFDKDITLADCAAKFYLNAAYFSKLFKEKAGISFTDYMVAFRMKKAMLYLCNPDYKVYEICNMVGYKTERYFYKVFREYTGLTPTEYRKTEKRS